MACGCGKGRRASARVGRQFVWDYTPPGATEAETYGSTLEARKAARRNGGGEIRRREVSTPTAA